MKKLLLFLSLSLTALPAFGAAALRRAACAARTMPTLRTMSTQAHRVLGVQSNASQKEIKAAFMELAIKHHPDRGGDATEFIKAKKAYDELMNPRLTTTNWTQKWNDLGNAWRNAWGNHRKEQASAREKKHKQWEELFKKEQEEALEKQKQWEEAFKKEQEIRRKQQQKQEEEEQAREKQRKLEKKQQKEQSTGIKKQRNKEEQRQKKEEQVRELQKQWEETLRKEQRAREEYEKEKKEWQNYRNTRNIFMLFLSGIISKSLYSTYKYIEEKEKNEPKK